MLYVLTEIIIHSHYDKVSEYAADPDNAPKWYVNIKSVEWKTQKPLSVGSKIALKAQFLGRVLSYIYQVTDYIPGKKIIMKTTQGLFRWRQPILGIPLTAI